MTPGCFGSKDIHRVHAAWPQQTGVGCHAHLAGISTLIETPGRNDAVSPHSRTRGIVRPVTVSIGTLVKLPVLTAIKSMIVTYMRDDVMALGTRNFLLRYPNILPRIAVNVGLAGL